MRETKLIIKLKILLKQISSPKEYKMISNQRSKISKSY